MNVFNALAHPTVAGDDDIGWVPTPFSVARRVARARPGHVGYDPEDDIGDDGEDLGDDGDEIGDDSTSDTDIGAVGRRLGRQVSRLDKRIARKKAAGKDTTRLQAHRARKAGKLARKLAKKGVDVSNPQEVQAAMSGGYPNTFRPGPPFAGKSIQENIANYALRNPPAGEEQPIPLLIDDPLGVAVAKTTQLFPFAISKTATTLAIVAQSQGIAYAAFQLIGVQCNAQLARAENASGFPNQDILLAAVLSSLLVDGFANTLYNPLPIDVVGVSGGMAGATQKVFTSLRSNDVIDKTNVVKAAGTMEQQIANAVAFNANLSIAAIARTIYDPAAGIRPSK